MLKRYKNIYQELNKEGADGGGQAAAEVPPETKAAENTASPEAEGDSVDEFGYKIEKAPVEPGEKNEKPGEKKAEPKVEVKEEITDPATGYGVEPPKEVVDDTPPPEEPKIDLGYELDLKEVPAEEVKKIQEFAKNNKLTKEAAQAFTDFRKAELAAATKAQNDAIENQKKMIAKTKVEWDKQLRSDPVFGGEKFASNIQSVEKVLKDFFPETKKLLTERKSMLPPWVVKDMARLAQVLYKGEGLVQGGKPEPEQEKVDDEFEHLKFYS